MQNPCDIIILLILISIFTIYRKMIEELEHQDVFICDDEEDILEDHSL